MKTDVRLACAMPHAPLGRKWSRIVLFSDLNWPSGKPFFLHWLCSEKISQCLKITETVSFNIASEASYVYINQNAKNDQKLVKMPDLKNSKMRHFEKISNILNF